MSKQVDSRIVEMQFDNKRFEQGVKTTLNSINTLDATLNKLNTISLKGFDKLGALGNISFDAITNAADIVSHRMSAMGVVGATVLQNLTNAAINTAKHLEQITIGQIMSGGKNRALNIEAAKFQLEGLHVAWEAIEGDLDYAVKGTAYGLDEAAKAASQLVASNVQVGDEMKQSLRAISGVAAMTNRSYEETAQIFTTVAGNGRLMGDQLQQLSSRGLNAAAIMAKGLGKTEAEIRKMVSKGEIDFKTFAELMDNEFGEHAKDANKTFTGALSNMKAALSRIGAEFYQPGLQDARDIFNSITGAVNNFKKALAEHKIFEDVSNIMKIVTEHVTGFFNALGDENGTMEKLVGGGLNKLHAGLSAIANFLQQGLIVKLLDTFKVHLQNAFKIVKAVFSGIKKAFPEDVLALFRRFINVFHDSASEFDKQATVYMRVRDTVAGIASAFKFVVMVLKTALQFSKPLFNLLGKGIKTVLKYTGELGNKITSFVQNTDLYTLWYNALHKISPKIEEIKNKVTDGIKNINAKFKETFGKDIPETVDEIKGKISGIFTGKNKIMDSAKGLMNNGTNPFAIMAQQLGKSEEEVHRMVEAGEISFSEYAQMINNVMGEGTVEIGKQIDIWKVFAVVIDVVMKAVEMLAIAFGKVYEFFTGKINIVDILSQTWGKLVEWVKTFFDLLKGNNPADVITKDIGPELSDFLSTIGDIFGSLMRILKESYNSVIKPILTAIAEGLRNLSFGDILKAGGLAAAFLGIKKISDMVKGLQEMKKSGVAGIIFGENINKVGEMFGSISGFFDTLKQRSEEASKVAADKVLLRIAAAVGILAVSMSIIGHMDTESIGKSLISVTALLAELMGALALIDKKIKMEGGDLKSLVTIMLMLSASVFLLASALKKVSRIDPERLFGAILGITVLFAELGAALWFMSKKLKKMPDVAKTLLALGISIRLLASAIAVIGKLDLGGVLKGLLGIGGVLVEIFAFATLMKGKTKTFASLSKSLIMFAFALDLLTVPLIALAVIGKAGVLMETLLGLGGILLEIAGFAYILKEYVGDNSFAKLAGSLILFTVALNLLIPPLIALALIASGGQLESTLLGLGVLLAEIAAFSYLMTDKVDSKSFIALAASLIVFAVALNVMIPPLLVLSGIAKGGTLEETMFALAALLGMIAAFSVIMTDMIDGNSFIKLAASLIVFAVALNVMIPPLLVLSSLAKKGTLAKSLLGLAVLLAEIAAFSAVMSKIDGQFMLLATSLIVFGAALSILMIPLTVISKIGGKDLAKSLVGLLVLLAEIALFSVVMNKLAGGGGGLIVLAGGLILMAVALTALTAPLAILSKIPFANMLKALGALAIFLGILAAFGALFGFVPELILGLTSLAACVLVLGAGVALLGVGILALGAGVKLLAEGFKILIETLIAAGNAIVDLAVNAANAILAFIVTLANSVPEIEGALLAIIFAICDIIIMSVPKIVETIFILINAVLEKIAEGIPQIIENIGKLIVGIIEALAAFIPSIAKALYDFLHNLIVSIGEYVPKLTEDLYELCMEIINGAVGLLKRTPFDLFDIVFGGGFKKEGGTFSKIKNLFKGSDKEELENAGEEVANTVADSTAENIDTPENQDKIGNSMEGLIEGAAGKLMGNTAIGDAMGGLAQGGLDSMTDVLNVQGGESIETQKIAGFAADGFLNEATSGDILNSFFDAGSLQGDSYQNGLMTSLDINSPSKVTEKIAGYADQGFAIGLEQSNASENAANEKASGLMTIFETIGENASKVADGFKTPDFSSLFDMNLNPVISPVLDLSNVSSGFGALDTMFNNNRSIALAGEASYIQDAGRNLSLSIQNDNNNNVNGGLRSVGEKLDRLGETLLNRQIVLDSGELVGGLVNPMDRALGVRTIRAQRGGRR